MSFWDLFKKKPSVEPEQTEHVQWKPPSRGFYIWRASTKVRFFLVGNEPLTGGGVTPGSQLIFRQMRLCLGRLVYPDFQLDDDTVRVYRNYIAITTIDIVARDELVDKALMIISGHLGWPDIPLLGEIRTDDEFAEINIRHSDENGPRWRLGRHY